MDERKDWISTMLYINVMALITVVAFAYLYRAKIQNELLVTGIETKDSINAIVLLLLGSFVFRLFASIMYEGYPTDMNCFYAWSHRVVDVGFNEFYSTEVFTDYPAGYMYILYVLGLFLKLFGTTSSGDILAIIILKMPAILCDLAIGYYIYKIAKERFTQKGALICSGIYLLNPAVILNSAIWGQVDSVYTLFLVYMCYQLTKKKYNLAIMAFAIGSLLKLQMIIFTPILLFVCVEASFVEYVNDKMKFKFHKEQFLHILMWSFIGIGTMIVLMLPYGFTTALAQYIDTLGSYEQATVNGYNIWMLFGLNWVDQNNTFLGIRYVTYGQMAIVTTVIFSAILYFKSRRESSRIFITGAFISMYMFMFAVRMHERYVYPALILLLLSFIYRPNKKVFAVYTLFSVVHFYNVAHVLFFYDPGNYDWEAKIPKAISLATLLVFLYFSYVVIRHYIIGKSEHLEAEFKEESCKKESQKAKRLASVTQGGTAVKNKIMWLRILRIVVICGILVGFNWILAKDVSLFYEVNDWIAIDGPYRNKVLLQLLCVVAMMVGTFMGTDFLIKRLGHKEEVVTESKIMTSEKKIKLGKYDYLIMLAITGVYAVVALYNLGYNYAPESQWSTYEANTEIMLDFGEEVSLSRISVYLGQYENREFSLWYMNEGDSEWTQYNASDTGNMNFYSVFTWNGKAIDIQARYLTLITLDDWSVLNEMVFLDQNGNQVTPINGQEYVGLFDEQEMYEPGETYRSGTYFDEIYHARTAYEYMNGLYSYENTHPPFGKIIIAIGMMIFGVNPFGWRIMGTLFGIAMLPLIYIFGRKFFKDRFIAGIVSFLFAVDFMHFAQTRIATIDVFVTFFIILMYYFMYQYTRLSFYDRKLSKTFIPLGLCGITMGFSIATKMTGVYAAVGLAIIFFANLYKRFREYQYAKETPQGETAGISHQYVVNSFFPSMWKTIAFCVGVFIVIPAIIYTLSYIPFVSTEGMGLVERMLRNQETMFGYHSSLEASHAYSSNWFQWPMMYRPTWYYSGAVSDTLAEGISTFGNPLIWWIGMPAFVYTIYYAVKKKDKLGAFLVIAYLSQFVPWILVPRLTYIYHYFPSVPFVIMMIAYCIKHLIGEFPKLKPVVWGYLIAALVLFVMFYPVLSGMPVSKDYVSTFLRWFDSWVLLSR